MHCSSIALPGLLIVALHLIVGADLARSQDAGKKQKDIDLFALALIEIDLDRTQRTMDAFDRDSDGKLDGNERRELAWPYAPLKFDLDRSGDLTHAEVALQFAYRRALDDVEERDEIFARRNMYRYDRNRDWVLDETEISEQHWPDNPQAFDTDRDGRLDEFEVSAGLRRERQERDEAGVTGLDNGQAIWVVLKYDLDKDRRLDRDEFEASLTTLSRLLWSDTDTNRDGLVTTTELAHAMAARRRKHKIAMLDQRGAYYHMTRVDRNRDRLLDADEILQGKWPEHPDRYDTDNNEILTRFELEAKFADERHKLGVNEEDQLQAIELVRHYDKNRNHYIDLHELKVPRDDSPPGQVTVESLIEYDFDVDQRLAVREVATLFAMRRQKKDEKNDEKKK